jgi:TBC1 domain family member 5
MLLLKYPAPSPAHGPKTFVDDAIYLREHYNSAGGAMIIEKYSGNSPTTQTSLQSSSPLGQSASPRQKLSRTRPPLPSPARFLQQQGTVGDLFQGAAKGLFDRGERLGINQAVRNAVEEAKKNMQDLQTPRSNSVKGRRPAEVNRWSLDGGRSIPPSQQAIDAINSRNQQLASILGKALSDLRAVSSSKDGDKDTYIKAMELAIAKVEFVKAYLEDPSLPVAMEPPDPKNEVSFEEASGTTANPPQVALPETPKLPPSARPATVSTPFAKTSPQLGPILNSELESAKMQENSISPVDPLESGAEVIEGKILLTRPRAPLPTRSTIAQSNFAVSNISFSRQLITDDMTS